MSEEAPKDRKERNVTELTEQTRVALIKEFEKALRIYTSSNPNWGNKRNCEELIDDLRNKRPTGRIGGPFWGDLLDGVLNDLGLKLGDEDGLYIAVRDKLEGGK